MSGYEPFLVPSPFPLLTFLNKMPCRYADAEKKNRTMLDDDDDDDEYTKYENMKIVKRYILHCDGVEEYK